MGVEVISRGKKKINSACFQERQREPAHAGYVGYGMLDAVAEMVASHHLTNTWKESSGRQWCRCPYGHKNYSGDVMNFQMAGELAKPKESNRLCSKR